MPKERRMSNVQADGKVQYGGKAPLDGEKSAEQKSPPDNPQERQGDEYFMRLALKEAHRAFDRDEVPVGCVIVRDGEIIARSRNTRAGSRDVFGHAECNAIKRAAKKIGDWRLTECTLYVTLEPCAMCVGAAVNARIGRIVFGAYDEKAGCCVSAVALPQLFCPNHRTECTGGVLGQECSDLLKSYFVAKRSNSNKKQAENK